MSVVSLNLDMHVQWNTLRGLSVVCTWLEA